MKTKQIIFGVLITIAVLITAVSFLTLKSVHNRSTRYAEQDKAEPLYLNAKAFLEEGEYGRACEVLSAVINEYPKSPFAEQAAKKLIEVYRQKGENRQARDHAVSLLENFPNIEDAGEIRSLVEDLNMKIMLSPEVTEDSVEYSIQPGDTLSGIARKFNTTVSMVKKVNGITGDIIYPGRKLKVIVSKFSIFVNKHKNVLILKKDNELFKIYTVSTGKDNSTPIGRFKIEEKMIKPLWYKVGAVVSADSEEYELGERWMGLSVEGYGIHGTSDETTIGSQVTRGCVRMYNADVSELFDIIPSGTEVEIVDGV
ncbi:MAG: L,D-transpeptidase family protein [Candidatus Omnitrophica bacterium]|nr:L,D-transpeptidase family protein [Candidatus Omnitrophota bacterium]